MNSHTKTLCIVLGIVLLAGIASCAVFVQLIRKSVGDIHKAEAAVQEQLARQKENELVKTLLTEVGPQIETLKNRIVDSQGTVPFIDNLEVMAHDIGAEIEIGTVAETAAEEGEGFENLMLTLSVTGSWDDVYTYVSMLEALPYKVAIRSVTLEQGAKEEITGTGNAKQTKSVIVWRGNVSLTVLKKK